LDINARANNFVKYYARHYLETFLEIEFMGCIFPEAYVMTWLDVLFWQNVIRTVEQYNFVAVLLTL
jgi:hypothetical protein